MKIEDHNAFLESLSDTELEEFNSYMITTAQQIVKDIKPGQIAEVSNHLTVSDKYYLVVTATFELQPKGLQAAIKEMESLTLEEYLESASKLK